MGSGDNISNGYKKLDVWDLAYEMSLKIHRVTRNFPKDENFGLKSQMRRASVSIIANLAVGHGRDHIKEFICYVSISIGSCNELEVYIMLSHELEYITENDYNDLLVKHENVSKMLSGSRKGLKKRSNDLNDKSDKYNSIYQLITNNYQLPTISAFSLDKSVLESYISTNEQLPTISAFSLDKLGLKSLKSFIHHCYSSEFNRSPLIIP